MKIPGSDTAAGIFASESHSPLGKLQYNIDNSI